MKTMRVLKQACTAVAIGLLTGCATGASGTGQDVTFICNPENATVTVGGKVIGTTPLTIYLKKDAGQSVTFEREGYKPLTIPLDTRSPAEYIVTLEPTRTSR